MTITSGPSGPARHFTVQSLARYWGVSPSHIYNLIHTGAIRYLRIGKAIRVPVLSVKEYEEAACRQTMTSSDCGSTTMATGMSSGQQAKQTIPIPGARSAYLQGQQTAKKPSNSAPNTSRD
ncbi:MAG: DNA-binding protein [Proteobacteria bacterium]|nr:DNA-binding protein [Pseudomonadota bacterium]